MSTDSSVSDRRSVPVYEALAACIKGLGVDVCFGLMSDDTIGLVVSLDAMGVEFRGLRHETNAVVAAEGYAAATGRLGVCIIGRGPAAANGMHGLVVSSRTKSPVLVVMGEGENVADPGATGPDYKEYNAPGVMTAAGLKCHLPATSADAVSALRNAVVDAMRGETVTLHLKPSVQNGLIEQPDTSWRPPAAPALPAPRARSIEQAADILGRSRRPLILVGAGAHRAGVKDEILALADKLGAVLISSLKGRDLAKGYPYDLGLMGSFSNSAARRVLEHCDCVLVLGASLNRYTTSRGHALPDVPVIQVDSVRKNIGRWYPVDVGIAGDMRTILGGLMARLPDRQAAEKPLHTDETRTALANFDVRNDFVEAHTPRTIDPRILAIELDRVLPAERNLVYDSGNFLLAAQYIGVPNPGCLKLTSEFASIGAGFGTAVGFATGRPATPTVLVIGDGAFIMTLSELDSAARLGVRLIVIVFNDAAYGSEVHISRARGLPDAMSVFPDVDLAPLGEAFGFEARTVRTLEDLYACEDLLRNADGPVLLDCKVNGEIEGPFIVENALGRVSGK